MALSARRPTPAADTAPDSPPGGAAGATAASGPAGAADRVPTFASLAVRSYRLLFISGAISFLSVQAQMVARGWLANELTGSATGLGGVYMAFGVPMLLATPFGGVVADRWSKRNVLVGTQLALGGSALWLAVAIEGGFVAYWMLLVVSAVQAVAFAFLGPARMAFTGELVGRRLLPNAIVLGQMSMNSTRIFGPAAAGVLIGVPWFGLSGVYFAAAALSMVALATAAVLPAGRPRSGGPRRSPGREFLDGLSYVRAHREVLLLVVTSFVVVMVAFPYVAFLPRVADALFDVGAGGYGIMSAASAVGALGVSFLIAGRASGPAAWRLQTLAGIGFGVGVLLLAVAPTFPLALLSIVVIGAAASGFQSMNNSLVLALSDFEYHGRIQSLMMLSFSGFGMAALPLGRLADTIGLRQTFGLMSAVTLATMALYVVVRGRPARLAARLG